MYSWYEILLRSTSFLKKGVLPIQNLGILYMFLKIKRVFLVRRCGNVCDYAVPCYYDGILVGDIFSSSWYSCFRDVSVGGYVKLDIAHLVVQERSP